MRRKIISFAYSLLSPIAPVISSLAPKRSRTRSTIVVSFAEIASYALVFLAGLVVLWFLDPEEYASKALVFAIVGVFSVTSDMGIGTAAIRLGSINEKKAKDFVTTAGIARLAFGTIMFLAYFALAPLISDFYGGYEITPFIIVLALAYFAQSFQTFAVPYWTIKRNFKRLAVLKIIYGVVFFIANVTLIYLYGLSGLFYAFLLSMVVFTLSLLYKVEHGVFKLSLFKQMIPFAAAMFSTLLLTYVLQNYDTLYLGLFETPANLGYYAVAYILFYPLLLISSALHTVLLPDVSKMSDEKQWNEVSRLFHKSLKSAVIVLTVSIIAFTTAFYGLLQLFFNNYLPVMEYLPWLAIPFVLEAAIGSVCTVFLLAINKAKQVAKIKLFQVAIGVVAGYFLISTLGVWGAITSTWIVYATGSAGYYYYTKKTLECKK